MESPSDHPASDDTPSVHPLEISLLEQDGVTAVAVRPAAPDAPGTRCPLMLSRVPAGFPSPADDFEEGPLDIAEYLVDSPETTYFVRVEGESMEGVGIHHGDLLVVDRSKEPRQGDVVVAALNGVLTVKRLEEKENRLFLTAEHPSYDPIEVRPCEDLVLWGVVRHVIHEMS